MNMPLELCEARDTKGLYKLARSGKIKGVLCETFLSCCFNTLTQLSAFKTQSPPPQKKTPKQKRKSTLSVMWLK